MEIHPLFRPLRVLQRLALQRLFVFTSPPWLWALGLNYSIGDILFIACWEMLYYFRVRLMSMSSVMTMSLPNCRIETV